MPDDDISSDNPPGSDPSSDSSPSSPSHHHSSDTYSSWDWPSDSSASSDSSPSSDSDSSGSSKSSDSSSLSSESSPSSDSSSNSSPSSDSSDGCKDEEYFVSSFDDASGPRYRKVALHGRPLPDEKPQSTEETDEPKEQSYVDAYTLGLQHSTGEVYVPIGVAGLAVSCRRNVKEEGWHSKNGLLPGPDLVTAANVERPDLPFGICWSSSLCPNIQFVIQQRVNFSDPCLRIDPDYAFVTDEAGEVHKFVILYEGGLSYFVALPSSVSEQETYLSKLEGSFATGQFVFTKKYGTRISYQLTALDQILPRDHSTAPVLEHNRWAQALVAQDRFGCKLVYAQPSLTTLLPTSITGFAGIGCAPQRMEIIHDGARVSGVKDPLGNEYTYAYTFVPVDGTIVAQLDNYLAPPDSEGQRPMTSYTYDVAREGDHAPDAEIGSIYYHTNLNSITDPRREVDGFPTTLRFSYALSNRRWWWSSKYNIDFLAAGQPRTVASIALPGGIGTTYFEDHSQMYFLNAGAELVGRVVTKITDAMGNARVYDFGSPAVTFGSDWSSWLSSGDHDPRRLPRIIYFLAFEIFHYSGDSITFLPASGVPTSWTAGTDSFILEEVFKFSLEAGLALSSVREPNGAVITYDHTDPLPPPALVGFTYFFNYWPEPNVETRTLWYGSTGELGYTPATTVRKTFTYGPYRVMTSSVDAIGRLTENDITGLGLRVSEMIFNRDGAMQSWSTFEYTNPHLPWFMTKKITKKHGGGTPTGGESFDASVAVSLISSGSTPGTFQEISFTMSPQPSSGSWSITYRRPGTYTYLCPANTGPETQNYLKSRQFIRLSGSTPPSLTSVYLDFAADTGWVRVWFNYGSNTPPAVPSGGRLLAVTMPSTLSCAAILSAMLNTLIHDGAFTGNIYTNPIPPDGHLLEILLDCATAGVRPDPRYNGAAIPSGGDIGDWHFQTIFTGGDGPAAGKYFLASDVAGSVGVWFRALNVWTTTSMPSGAAAAHRQVAVDINPGASSGDVAVAVQTAFAADSGLDAKLSPSGLVVFTTLVSGTISAPSNGNASGHVANFQNYGEFFSDMETAASSAVEVAAALRGDYAVRRVGPYVWVATRINPGRSLTPLAASIDLSSLPNPDPTWVQDLVTEFYPGTTGLVAAEIVDPGFDFSVTNNGPFTVNGYTVTPTVSPIGLTAYSTEPATAVEDYVVTLEMPGGLIYNVFTPTGTLITYDVVSAPLPNELLQLGYLPIFILGIPAECLAPGAVTVLRVTRSAAPAKLNLTTRHDYDLVGSRRQTQDPNGNTTRFDYDTCNRLTGISDSIGQKLFIYDGSSNKIGVRDENGTWIFRVFDVARRLKMEWRDMVGTGDLDEAVDLVTHYSYNAVNSVIEVKDPRGFATQKEYDALQRPVIHRDAYSNETEFVYELDNNCGAGTFDVSLFKATKTIDRTRGYFTINRYDSLYRLREVQAQFILGTEQDWAVKHHLLDLVGNVIEEITKLHYDGVSILVASPDDRRVQHVYDALNRVIQNTFFNTNPLGPDAPPIESYNYSYFTSTGLQHRSKDELDRESDFTFDAAQRKTESLGPEVEDTDGVMRRPSIQSIFDRNGNALAIIDPRKYRTDFQYDARNRKTVTQQPIVSNGSGGSARPLLSWLYDAVGNVRFATDALNNTTESQYDRANRLTDIFSPPILDPANPTSPLVRAHTHNQHDKNGNLEQVTDPNGNVTINYYDRLNRLETTQNGAGNVVRYEYDSAGNRTLVQDGRQTGTLFGTQLEYDGLNRNIKSTDAVGESTEFHFDAVEMVERVDAESRTTQMQYDLRGRLVATLYIDRTDDNRTQSYDLVGNLLTVTEPAKGSMATAAYTYDALNRKSTERSSNVLQQYHYDLANNRVKVEQGGTDRVIQFTFDALNRLTVITETDRTTTYDYNLRGDLVTTLLANGESIAKSYDALRRVTLINKTGTGAAYSYAQTYDLVGNVATLIEHTDFTRTVTMEYDGANRLRWEHVRLTGITQNTRGKADRDTEHVYDASDNRTHEVTNYLHAGPTDPPGTPPPFDRKDFTYNDLNQIEFLEILHSSGYGVPAFFQGVSYSYDNVGNRTQRTVSGITQTYSYDYDNRLVAWGPGTSGASEYEYAYDYRTRRIQIGENAGAGWSNRYFVFSGGNHIQEWEDATDISMPDFALDDPDNPGVDAGYSAALVCTGLPSVAIPLEIYGHAEIQNTTGGITKTWIYSDAARTHQIGYFENPSDNPRVRLNAATQQTGDDFLGGMQIAVSIDTLFSVAVTADFKVVMASSPQMESLRGVELGGGIGGLLYALLPGDSEPVPSFSHYNCRGDVVSKSAPDGSTQYAATYEAFGTRTIESGATPTRQRANTKDQDPTGLLNEGLRYRDLETGTFVTHDPIGLVDGPNLYTYVNQNPWSKFDPKGLQAIDFRGLPNCPTEVRTALDEIDRVRARELTQQFNDVAAWTQAHPRIMGAVKTVGGAAETLAGIAGILTPEPTMATKVAGSAAVGHGSDTFIAGVWQMISGTPTHTVTQDAIAAVAETAGASHEHAQTIGAIGDGAIGIGTNLGVNAVTKPAAVASRVSAAEAATLSANGVTKGVVNVLVVPNGLRPDVFVGLSVRAGGGGRAALEPSVALIAARNRSLFNFGCGEGQALSGAIRAGVNPLGGASSARSVADGVAKAACDNCAALLKSFGVKDAHAN